MYDKVLTTSNFLGISAQKNNDLFCFISTSVLFGVLFVINTNDPAIRD